MNRTERALKALHIEEPDAISITELEIDVPHMEVLTEGAS